MRLVPRQLQRHGMTGRMPYYGGRLTPDQAYAAAHPTAPPPPHRWTPRFGPPSATNPPTAPPAAAAAGADSVPGSAQPPQAPGRSRDERLVGLQALRDSGVLTDEEFEALREQVSE